MVFSFSPWNGGIFPVNLAVGGMRYDENNSIVSAQALQIVYRIFANISFNEKLGKLEDPRRDDVQAEMNRIGQRNFETFHSYVYTKYGFNEEALNAIQDDLTILAAGYVIIIFYVCINLGKATRLKHKIWLSVGGVLSTGLSIGASFGLCSAFGLFYGPLHSVLPFLLIGELYGLLD